MKNPVVDDFLADVARREPAAIAAYQCSRTSITLDAAIERWLPDSWVVIFRTERQSGPDCVFSLFPRPADYIL